ncbi:hypothetical protein [Fibrivirga algicola]|uniref:DUF4203 domain-containing protein n=1 Tax=Fibrivirga algicola TaxID=2950420 RepID=A0ABX0QDH8_9BACT|nr:hypothetical protein [Fibrivirga algicola]NID09306.1 hypothetical protein [Fibrivirga algicola]
MKHRLRLLVIWVFTLYGTLAFGQVVPEQATQVTPAIVTSASSGTSVQSELDDFAPGLLAAALVFLVFFLVCIGIGIGIALVGISILAGLISFGVLSTSSLFGLRIGPKTTYFSVFWISCLGLFGAAAGLIGLFILNEFHHWFTTQTALYTGTLAGLAGGALTGWLSHRLVYQFITHFKIHLSLLWAAHKHRFGRT